MYKYHREKNGRDRKTAANYGNVQKIIKWSVAGAKYTQQKPNRERERAKKLVAMHRKAHK